MTYRSLEYIRGRATRCRIEAGIGFGLAAGGAFAFEAGPPDGKLYFAVASVAMLGAGVISALEANAYGHEVAIREAAISQATLNRSVPPQH